MPKGVLIFPFNITLAGALSSVIFISYSIFLGIPKLIYDPKAFFIYAAANFFKINEKEVKVRIMRVKFF
jgi:hypothetical protein